MQYSAPFALLLLIASSVASAQINVRHQEGSLHGFLVLRSDSGEILATRDLNSAALPAPSHLSSEKSRPTSISGFTMTLFPPSFGRKVRFMPKVRSGPSN